MIEPESYILHYNLGRAYFEIQKYGEAQKAIEDALRLKPDFETAKKLLTYLKSQK